MRLVRVRTEDIVDTLRRVVPQNTGARIRLGVKTLCPDQLGRVAEQPHLALTRGDGARPAGRVQVEMPDTGELGEDRLRSYAAQERCIDRARLARQRAGTQGGGPDRVP